jgi:hypothetical protein
MKNLRIFQEVVHNSLFLFITPLKNMWNPHSLIITSFYSFQDIEEKKRGVGKECEMEEMQKNVARENK